MAATSQTLSIEHQGGSRFVRIPEEYALTGDQILISQDGAGRLILEPIHSKSESLAGIFDSWHPLSDEDAMPEIPDLNAEPFEL